MDGSPVMNSATKLPLDVGPIHFVGIGGIGMSGIAEVLLSHGYVVQGSDLKESAITKRLQKLGAHIFEGQRAENVEAAEVMVISSAGEWMVVEADESDGTFNRLPATIAIVTNIDPEHMEHWGTEENLHRGFYDFVSNIPFYGVAVCCTDDSDVQSLVGKITDRRVVTYGFNAQADVRAVNLTYKKGVAHFDVQLQAENMVIEDCALPMPGDHNVSNALSAIAERRAHHRSAPTPPLHPRASPL